jgi:hypothetical protein
VNRAASHPNQLQMPQAHSELPTFGFAIEVDGRLKTQFSTPEGARSGAGGVEAPIPDASGADLRCRSEDPARRRCVISIRCRKFFQSIE